MYWLNIVLFKQKCNIGMKAYDIYSNNICYLCNQFNVYYNYTQYLNGACFDKKLQINAETTTVNPSELPTKPPMKIPTKNPSQIPTVSPILNPTVSEFKNSNK